MKKCDIEMDKTCWLLVCKKKKQNICENNVRERTKVYVCVYDVYAGVQPKSLKYKNDKKHLISIVFISNKMLK